MKKFTDYLFSAEELQAIRDDFYFTEADYQNNRRIFCDNAGGSLRLKAAEKRFAFIDSLPDASEHTNDLALKLAAVEDQGRADARIVFNAKHGAIATGFTASQLMMDAVMILSDHANGTNVVTSVLEHPSSFDAMQMYAEKHHRELRVAKANPLTGGIDTNEVLSHVDKNTAIVSIMAASNISGHIMDIKTIAAEVKKINPDAFIICDAVQHAPHGALDPEAWGVDVMNFAPYKFFSVRGFALMYLSDRVKDFMHHKLLGKASDYWEIGSPSTAQFTALTEMVNYVCRLGQKQTASPDRRTQFETGMGRIANQERALLELMLDGTAAYKGLRQLPGVTVKMDDPDLSKRDLIIGVEFNNMTADNARIELEKRGVVAYERLASSMYSARMLNEFDSQGVVRISPLHVNSPADIDLLLKACQEVAALK